MATAAILWLSGKRDYYAGVQILKDNGTSDFILDMLADGPDAYNTPKLLQEITALSKQPVAPIAARPGQSAPDLTLTEEITDIPGADQDLEKKLRLDAMIRQLFKEITHLHGQLGILPEGERLHQVAREILIKDLKKQDLFDQLHYYKNHGKWFDELPENQPKPFDLEQSIKNAMSRRTKAAAYLKKPLPATMVDYYQGKVDKINAEIQNLKLQRNG